jgi:hypothetical protein
MVVIITIGAFCASLITSNKRKNASSRVEKLMSPLHAM